MNQVMRSRVAVFRHDDSGLVVIRPYHRYEVWRSFCGRDWFVRQFETRQAARSYVKMCNQRAPKVALYYCTLVKKGEANDSRD
jgi:hypothetical protein